MSQFVQNLSSASNALSLLEKRRHQNKIAQRKYRRKIYQQAKQTEYLTVDTQQRISEIAAKGQSYCPKCDHCQASSFPLTPNFNIPVPFVPIPTSSVTDHSSLDAFPTSTFFDADHMHYFQHEDDESTTMRSESTLGLGCAEYCRETSAQTANKSESPKTEDALLHPDPLAFFIAERPSLNTGTAPVYYDSQAPEGTDPHSTPCSQKISGPNATSMQQQLDAAVLLAAHEGHSAIIAILLRRGAIVEARDGQGRTPLHICVENGHVDAAETLLVAGADCTSCDDIGQSIMSVAVQTSSETLVELLATNLATRQAMQQK